MREAFRDEKLVCFSVERSPVKGSSKWNLVVKSLIEPIKKTEYSRPIIGRPIKNVSLLT